ncbi:MAG: hypothetical protein WC025_00345 [Candidatus Magasanikbacteria bacterium]
MKILSFYKFIKEQTKLSYSLVSLVISFVLFGWTMKYGFFFSDDFTWMWHGTRIANGELSALTAHMSTFYSPVLNVFYAVMSVVFGFKAGWYFLFGILISVLTAFFVGLLVSKITKSSLVGFMAVVLCALVGGAYEPLIWIGANMHSIAALFMIISTFALLSAYKKTSRAVWWFLLSFVTLVLALATKEVSVVLPAILFFIAIPYLLKEKKSFFYLKNILYWLATATISIVYVVQQYLWQRGSVWVTQDVWKFSAGNLIRLPIILLDTFVPLKNIISAQNAVVCLLIAFFVFAYSIYKFRNNKIMYIGLFWSVMTILPVIFFKTAVWWELLPSRYMYTVRIGMIIFVCTIIAELYKDVKKKKFAYILFVFLIVTSFFQNIIMFETVKKEYKYVYQTGRALYQISITLREIQPNKVIVQWYRPFNNNYAHMIGVFDVISHISEEKIIFLDKNENYKLKSGEVFLGWDDKTEKYLLTTE